MRFHKIFGTYPFVMMWTSICIATGVLLDVQSSCHGYQHDIRFRHLSSDDGLSQNTINCILQDSRGFMWFGTQDGLNRYDGYSFTVYNHNPYIPSTLSNNEIRCMIEDRKGLLWIGTHNGLNRYNRETEAFDRFLYDPTDRHSLSHPTINDVLEDTQGSIWIATEAGLDRFNPRNKAYTHFEPGDIDSLNGQRSAVRTVYQDRSGIIWVGTEKGLWRFNQTIGQFSLVRRHPEVTTDITVFTIHEDTKGRLWIGTRGGLERVDPQSQTTNPFDGPMHGIVVDICEDGNGQLWIGTFEHGVRIIDSQRQQVIQCQHNPHDPASLSLNGIKCVFADKSGGIWIGTHGKGLNIWHASLHKFKHHQHDPKDPNTLGFSSIRAIYEDHDNRLWIGGYGGLDRYDNRTGQWVHFKGDRRIGTTLSNNNVMVIREDPDEPHEILWIGTEGGGLNKLILSTHQFKRFEYSQDGSRGLGGSNVYAICPARDGHLWIGTEKGLNRFDRLTETFTRFIHDEDNQNALRYSDIRVIHQDRNSDLWIGTHNGGLNLFDPKTNRCTPFLSDPNNPESLNKNSILSLLEDCDGNLWIGTNGGGLNSFDRASGTFQHYTKQNGLPNNVVYGILEDHRGHLWLSTNNGISRFDPQALTFRNYTSEDGLQSIEFNYNAYHNGRSGELFFGGINGLNAFYPDEVTDNQVAPSIVISEFQLFNVPIPIGPTENGRVILEQSITETKTIRLTHRDRVISFEFAGLHYASPEQNRYAYKMEGLEEHWNDAGHRRYATYTNLPPGKYAFRVKASNSDGIWNEEGTSLTISVTPPLWKTLWFQICGTIMMLSTLLVAHKIRTTQIKKRSRTLEAINRRLDEEIGERRHIEAALRESEARYHTVYETAPLAFVVWDRECRITDWNRRAEEIFGWSQDEVLGCNFFEFMVPEKTRPQFEETVKLLLQEKLPSHSVNENITKVGNTIVCEWNNSLLRSNDGQVEGAISLVLDITERKQLQEQLIQSEKMSALGQMISGIAHELNNPLTGVLGFSQLLLMSSDIHSETQQSITTIHNEAKRAQKIVHNLLTFARHQRSTKRQTNINEIITRTIELRAYEMRVNNIEVEQQLDPNCPATFADEYQLQQVFMNIIINAEQAMIERSGKGRLEVTTEWHTNHRMIEITFRDNGPGIPEHNLSRIFNPFFTTKPVGRGTGLGLSIAYGIIQEHGGHIRVASEEDLGSTFTIELPVLGTRLQANLEPTSDNRTTPDIDQKRILVIDDELFILELVTRSLTGKGHVVQTASNADAAIQVISKTPLDGIICDVKMPGKSGAHVYLYCKENHPTLAQRFLCMTGDVVATETLSFMLKHNLPCISKPFSLDDLNASLRDLFQTKDALKETST